MAKMKRFYIEEHVTELKKGVTAVILEISGFLDSGSFTELQERLDKLIDSQNIYLIISMKDLVYISSSGFATIIGQMQAARFQGGDLVICELPDKIWNLFEMLGFSRMINLYETEGEGVEYLNEVLQGNRENMRSVGIY